MTSATVPKSFPALAATLAAVAVGLPAGAQVTIVREPVYALDGRALADAARIMARTRFERSASSSIPAELAAVAAREHPGESRHAFERFFTARLTRFLAEARDAGLRTDDAGDARAAFIQIAFKIYDGRGFGDPSAAALHGPALWGEGAIAGLARSSASLARFAFASRLRFVMGSDPHFAALTDAGKQRVYDYYALSSQLLIDGYAESERDQHERALIRRTARQQLRLDLGVDPGRVHFTPGGIEID